MSSELPRHLQQIVDDICGDGCSRVNQIIKSLQDDEVVEVMESLSENERRLVLSELSTIMSVYEQR